MTQAFDVLFLDDRHEAAACWQKYRPCRSRTRKKSGGRLRRPGRRAGQRPAAQCGDLRPGDAEHRRRRCSSRPSPIRAGKPVRCSSRFPATSHALRSCESQDPSNAALQAGKHHGGGSAVDHARTARIGAAPTDDNQRCHFGRGRFKFLSGGSSLLSRSRPTAFATARATLRTSSCMAWSSSSVSWLVA